MNSGGGAVKSRWLCLKLFPQQAQNQIISISSCRRSTTPSSTSSHKPLSPLPNMKSKPAETCSDKEPVGTLGEPSVDAIEDAGVPGSSSLILDEATNKRILRKIDYKLMPVVRLALILPTKYIADLENSFVSPMHFSIMIKPSSPRQLSLAFDGILTLKPAYASPGPPLSSTLAIWLACTRAPFSLSGFGPGLSVRPLLSYGRLLSSRRLHVSHIPVFSLTASSSALSKAA